MAKDRNGKVLKHFASGNANAWETTGLTGENIKVYFSKQDTITRNIIISTILFVICMLIFISITKHDK